MNLKKKSSDHIQQLRAAFKKANKDKVGIQTAYEQLGRALLKEEKELFSIAEGKFKEVLDSEFNKILEKNPSARRQDYILDLPEIKLELDITEKAIKGANPVIRIIGEGEEHGPFFLRFIQSVIAKDPIDQRVFYQVEFGDLKGILKYGPEKAGLRGVAPPQVYVGDPGKALKYSEITHFLLKRLKRIVKNDEREIVKLIREFSNTGRLPTNFQNQLIQFDLKEKLSAFALIFHISEEARTPGTGTAVERLLKELYSPSSNSFLDVTNNGNMHRLTFGEIFSKNFPLLSFMVRRGADVWRKKHFKLSNQRIKAHLAKRKHNFENPDLLSGDERELVMGLNSNSMLHQSPLKNPKHDDSIDSSRKKRSIATITKEKGPSWGKVAVISLPLILHVGLAAGVIMVPIAICGAIQWFKKDLRRRSFS